MTKYLAAILLAFVLGGCATTGTAPTTPQQVQTTVQKLDKAWRAAQALALTATILKPDAAEDIDRAMGVAAKAVGEARIRIIDAAGDISAEDRALDIGLSALAVFNQALIQYRAKAKG